MLTDAGFDSPRRFDVVAKHRWNIEELIGFVYSTSFLPRPVLGARAPDFEADLATWLAPYAENGTLSQAVRSAYERFWRP